MKLILFFLLGYFALAAYGDTPDEAPNEIEESLSANSETPVKRSNQITNSEFVLSDGSRINIDDKHFSIKPPVGWEVHLGFPNVSLLMQVPFNPVDGYQRTIQVMKFVEGVPIDDITAKNFQEVITAKFSMASPAIEGYRIRNYTITDLANGHPSILFYSEFNIGDQNLMQAHLLASSANHRFLITFTDLAAHFEDDLAERYLGEAWESMISIELDSKPPFRLQVPAALGFGVGILFLLILLGIVYRRTKAGSEYVDLIDAVDTVKSLNESTAELEGTAARGLSIEESLAVVAKSALLDVDDDGELVEDEWSLGVSGDPEDEEMSNFDSIDEKVS